MDGSRAQRSKRRLSNDMDAPSKRSATGSLKPELPALKSFKYLPEELISQVVDYFSIEPFKDIDLGIRRGKRVYVGRSPQRERQLRVASLVNLCLVSRKLCRIAQPLLYARPPDLYSQRRRHQFTRTVLSRTDLAVLVQDLAYEQDDDDPMQPTKDAEIQGIYLRSVPNIRIGDKKEFLRALHDGDCDAEWAFLLHFLPNLLALCLSSPKPWSQKLNWTMSLLKHSMKQLRINNIRGPLCSLKAFRTRYPTEDVIVWPEFLRQLMKIPSLRELKIDSADDNESLGPAFTHVVPSKLQRLHFGTSGVSAELVDYLVRACEELNDFSFTWDGFRWTQDGMEAIFCCLLTRRSTVERVELLADNCYNIWEQSWYTQGVRSLRSLKGFEKLRYLKVEGLFLTGIPEDLDWENLDRNQPISPTNLDYPTLADAFPASLEELEINCGGFAIDESIALDYDEDIISEQDVTYLVPFLQELAQNCLANKLPNLATLRLCANKSQGRFRFGAIEHLLASVNVKIEFCGFVDGDEEVDEAVETETMQSKFYQVSRSGSPAQELTPPVQPPPASSGTSNSIDRLPDALLARIFDHFDPFNSLPIDPSKLDALGHPQRAPEKRAVHALVSLLQQLCLVSKRFYNIARPLMYKAFLDTGNPVRRLDYLDNMLANPSSAAYVKAIRLIEYRNLDHGDSSLRTTQDRYRRLLPKAESLEVGNTDTKAGWLALLQDNQEWGCDVEMPLLLSLVPDVEVLDLEYGNCNSEFTWTFWYLEQLANMIRKKPYAADAELPLGKLRNFNMDAGPKRLEADRLARMIGTVMSLPSLRSLSIRSWRQGLPSQVDANHVSPFEVGSSNVENLDFWSIDAGPDLLRMLVQACKTLKSFKYTHVYSPGTSESEPTTVRAIIDIVGFHRHSIESLAIRGPEIAFEADHTWMVSLKGFTQLKHVVFPAKNLGRNPEYGISKKANVDIFPPSVETIVVECRPRLKSSLNPGVHAFESSLDSWVKAFHDVFRNGQLPNLRSFFLETILSTHDSGAKLHMMELGPSLYRAGVAFTFNDWDVTKFFEGVEKTPGFETDSSASSVASDEDSSPLGH